MPSNVDLTKEANELAAELKLEITTDGLKNAGLVALVSDLKVKKKDAENPAAENAQAAKAAEDAPEVEKLPPFAVAKGKSITTKRGIKADGDEVLASDFPGGQKVLDDLVTSEYVVKNG